MHSRWMARIRLATISLAAAALCAAAVPAPAFAAGTPPAAPVLIAPAAGATVPPGTPLTVQASDPDDASVEVVFHGAPRGTVPPPGVGDPFTFAVLPDTQNYVITPTNNPIMTAQAQWFVANRDPLDIAFVAGVGDVVDNYTSAAQWTRASDNLAIMDAGGVPNSVLPGNHDFNLATGDFTMWNQYLPVSRYRDATWNSPAASYGGYYGQHQFGPDAADRQNMDNFALFTAGGMDFILVNLELNPPDDVLAWAQRVLSAHSNRRAIVATHAYVNVAGAFSAQVQRTDVPGNSGASIWQKLIQPNCNVFLVVNGHFTDLLDGEANRTDLNACGRPVHGALSDYQGRPNGGDGWLRYYTFTPAANEIRATTYSPTLNAYETDSDSSFVLGYDMSPPVDLPELGRQTVASGTQASVALPELAPGTMFDWYATVGDGTSTTRGATQSVTVSAPPPAGALAQDAFGRTVAVGLGHRRHRRTMDRELDDEALGRLRRRPGRRQRRIHPERHPRPGVHHVDRPHHHPDDRQAAEPGAQRHARRPDRRHLAVRRPPPDQPQRIGATPPHARRHRPVRHHRPRHHRRRRHPDPGPRPGRRHQPDHPPRPRLARPARPSPPPGRRPPPTPPPRSRMPATPGSARTSAPRPRMARSPSPTTTSPPPPSAADLRRRRRTFRPRRRSRGRRTD